MGGGGLEITDQYFIHLTFNFKGKKKKKNYKLETEQKVTRESL
jgi:hypothetical protein